MKRSSLRGLFFVFILFLVTVLFPESMSQWLAKSYASNGIITTFAGSGESGYSGDNGPATSAKLMPPTGVAVDRHGNVYIAENVNHIVRKISPDGIITTIAGTGEEGFSGDGGPAVSAQLRLPRGVAVDKNGNVYIADAGNHKIRKVSPAGIITTVAGTGKDTEYNGLITPDDLYAPYDVEVDNNGNVYILDSYYSRVRLLTPDGVVRTIVATSYKHGFSGDGGPAIDAKLNVPYGIAVDQAGNIYIADTHNRRIRKVSVDGIITTIAGTGEDGYSGDGGPAISAKLSRPHGITVDKNNNIYFADYDNHRVRKITPDGIITTVAGNGDSGYSGDGVGATNAKLNNPYAVAVDDLGNLYIADSGNNRIRKVVSPITVQFETNGGSSINTQTIIPGDNAQLPSDPTRVGYTFVGWYKDSTFTQPFDFDTPILVDTVLYAKWDINTYTLTYTAGENGTISGITNQIVNYGSSGTSVTAVPAEGYHFVRWSDGYTEASRTDTNITTDLNVIAEFGINTYIVTFDSNGGTEIDSQSVLYEGTPIEPKAPTKVGHTFSGWFTDENLSQLYDFNTPIYSNTKLFAKWLINQYTVNYESNGSEGGSVPASITQNYDTAVIVSDNTGNLTKTGHTFAGWNTASDGSGVSYASGDILKLGALDVTLYAQWNINRYTVTYDGNGSDGGNVPSPVTQDYNTDVMVSNNTGSLTKTGYTFSGWNTHADGSGTNYIAGDALTLGISDVTLYAQWTINQYTVSYDGNGSESGSVPASITQYYDTAVIVSDNTGSLTRTGYTFAGWNTASDGNGVSYASGDNLKLGASDVTLYAQWTVNQYTVTFDSNGGSVVDPITVNFNSIISRPIDPTNTGYTFEGWYINSTFSTPFDFNSPITSNFTLYANWLLNPTILSVDVPLAGAYKSGDTLVFIVEMSTSVDVTGTPILPLMVGSTARNAEYVNVSDSIYLLFEYTVQDDDTDSEGISIGDSISLNGGTIQDIKSVNAMLSLNNVGDTTGILIDTTAPEVDSVSVPLNKTYRAGDALEFTVHMAEPVVISGTPQLTLIIGNSSVQAAYHSGSGTEDLNFRYVVQGGNMDLDGIAIDSLSLNGGTITDFAGNIAFLTLNNVGDTNKIFIDTTVPAFPEITNPVQEPSKNQPSVKVTLSDGSEIQTELILQGSGQYEITIPSLSHDGTVEAQTSVLQEIASKDPNAVLNVGNDYGWFEIPLNELLQSIDEDTNSTMTIQIQEVQGDSLNRIKQELSNQNLAIISEPIEYQIFITDENDRRSINEFNTYFTRAIRVSENVDADGTVVVWYDPIAKEWRPVPTLIQDDGESKNVLFKRRGSSTYAVVNYHRSFSDIAQHWAEADIKVMASKLIAKGITDDLFAPNAPITRAEFTTLLVRSLGISIIELGSQQLFTDVSTSDWFAYPVFTASNAGLINGYDDGSFRPNQTITRQEVAVMLYRALEYVGWKEYSSDSTQALGKFTDRTEIATWATQAVGQFIEDGIINGKTTQLLKPLDISTRAEAIVMLRRFLMHIEFMN